jgi:GATA-binding protein, other eukaryote
MRFVQYIYRVGLEILTTSLGLYYKLHGVHRPVTMKKATIKRRKRVIPANQDEEMDDATETASQQSFERTPERGTVNDDGSVNLGLRRGAEQPMTIEPRHAIRPNRQHSPLSTSSDLAAYQQQSLRPRNPGSSMNEDNRLPPLNSFANETERQSSMSPASFMSSARKRSFSSTEPEPRQGDDGGSDGTKRLSSIKSILNPSFSGSGSHLGGSALDDRDYSLPPLRSPGTTVASAPSPGMYSTRDHTPTLLEGPSENEQSKASRRAALQKEAERMREVLAAKERELLELGND